MFLSLVRQALLHRVRQAYAKALRSGAGRRVASSLIEAEGRGCALEREEGEAEAGSARFDAPYERLADTPKARVGRNVVEENLARSRHGGNAQDCTFILGHEDVVGANPLAHAGGGLVGEPQVQRLPIAL